MTTTGKKLRMGVLFGGRSEEHEVSLASAASTIGYLDACKYEAVPIGITRSGKWPVGSTPAELQTRGTREAGALDETYQAIQAFRALSLSGMARVDFFLEKKTGRLFINEVNTWPSFTHICMYPRLCAESGLPYPLLLERLIEPALERHADRQSKRTGLFKKPLVARVSSVCG